VPARFAGLYRRLRGAAVKWVISFRDLPAELVVPRGELKLPEITVPLRLFELRGALPRAYYVPGHEVERDPVRRARRLEDPGFDAAHTALLDLEPPAPTRGAGPADAWVAYEPVNAHTVRIRARTPPGFLVVLDGYHAGWTAEEPKGETTSAMGFKISEVERSYTKGDERLHVKIVDGAYNSFIYAGVTMAAQFSRESTEGYEKGVTIDGNPGVEKWSKGSRRGELTVVVGKRFLVTVDASPVEADFARTVFGSIDQAKLASLK